MTRYGARPSEGCGKAAVAAIPAAGQRVDHMHAHMRTKAATAMRLESLIRFSTSGWCDTSILAFPAQAEICIDIGCWRQSSNNLPKAC